MRPVSVFPLIVLSTDLEHRVFRAGRSLAASCVLHLPARRTLSPPTLLFFARNVRREPPIDTHGTFGITRVLVPASDDRIIHRRGRPIMWAVSHDDLDLSGDPFKVGRQPLLSLTQLRHLFCHGPLPSCWMTTIRTLWGAGSTLP